MASSGCSKRVESRAVPHRVVSSCSQSGSGTRRTLLGRPVFRSIPCLLFPARTPARYLLRVRLGGLIEPSIDLRSPKFLSGAALSSEPSLSEKGFVISGATASSLLRQRKRLQAARRCSAIQRERETPFFRCRHSLAVSMDFDRADLRQITDP